MGERQPQEKGLVPALSPQEILFNLGIDEAALDDLITSSGAQVDHEHIDAARVIAADILLASIFAADLPEAVDFDAVLGLLTITNDTAFAELMPDLATKVLALAAEDRSAAGADLYEQRMRMARDRIFGMQIAA